MTAQPVERKRYLTVFALVMITAGSVDSIRNLPTTALFGSAVIFFFILAAVCFLFPSALASAELSATYPGQGGIYVWVREAFGKRLGLLAVWFQWIENVIWYPTILSFIAGTVAYLVNPSLASNKYFIIIVILCAFWGTTFINLMGIRNSARFASICAVLGLLLPMTLIIILGGVWVYKGMPMDIQFTKAALLPNFHDSDIYIYQ